MTAQEPALANDYRGGGIDETNNLTDVAIIDLRGPDAGSFHDAYRSWAIRARLEQAEGHFPKNDVIWFGETPLLGDPNYAAEGLVAMDQWLSAVEADHRNISLERKIAADRPADVHDQCSDIPDVDEVVVPGVGEVCQSPLPAPAAEPVGLLPDHVQRHRVDRAPADLPDRRLRLVQAGRRPTTHDPLADLPNRRRQGDLRRQAAGAGAGRVRRRMDQRLV
jgi:hypothetical protein